jgi:succinate dehydrogenase / fumarate reductase cytochrome b subunit
MSKSTILSSSIAKKWWMALTGLFLCLFLIGHLIGNLQLIFIKGVEGKRAFNEYAYFMGTNPLIKILSYLTYISIIFHAIDGLILTLENRKSRPEKYVYEKPNNNSRWYSRSMAILGSMILIFLVIHMQNFWWKMKYSSKHMPIHKEFIYQPALNAQQNGVEDTLSSFYYTTNGSFLPEKSINVKYNNKVIEFYQNKEESSKQIKQFDPSYTPKGDGPKIGEGYKDLYSLVFAFFGHDKTKEAGIAANKYALICVIIYTISMFVLAFHLLHGFTSAFQSLGLYHKKYNSTLKFIGKLFAVLVPVLFAIIPIIIYLNK